MNQLIIASFDYSARFAADLRSAPREVQQAARRALTLLLTNPCAKTLRLHPLSGTPKPTVWKIDVFANHSWQITFDMNGDTAVLRRLGTHKAIDRDPR